MVPEADPMEVVVAEAAAVVVVDVEPPPLWKTRPLAARLSQQAAQEEGAGFYSPRIGVKSPTRHTRLSNTLKI
jgi:uncharacterized membrane protein YcjF (UPF0283 family)